VRKRRIILAYHNPVIKFYCLVRFIIIRINILEKFSEPLRQFTSGHVLDVGCGFGLFAIYNATRHPGLTIHGVDYNRRRIAEALAVSRRLRVDNVRFRVGDVRRLDPEVRHFKVIYMLDILHHIPVVSKYRLLRKCHRLLEDDGLLVIKDIDTGNRLKVAFTWLLDKLMGPVDAVSYQSSLKLQRMLEYCGFEVTRRELIDDILPYPHMVLLCRKRA